MKKIISIIDYGLGNIVSAQQSFLKVSKDNKIDAEINISNNPLDIIKSTHIVLPGQGAFKSCMQGLKDINGNIDLSTSIDFEVSNKFKVENLLYSSEGNLLNLEV